MAPDPGSAPPPEDIDRPARAPEADEERRVAGSPHAVAANAALLALTRAARSFTLYDPANKVVRTLIAEYREKLEKVLAGFGPMELEVHPFELLLGREVVYLEKDRERSLAFRLFRDGVRKIAFRPGTTWDELLSLLQILSIRYTGVRQQEDDLVTLLRKASFEHVVVAAIEGFLPEEESAESPYARTRGAGQRRQAPAQWDLPLPAFQDSVPLRYRPVPADLLERLCAEEADAGLPRSAVRAVAELLNAPGPREMPMLCAFALEVREFLLLEKQAELATQLALLVAREAPGDPAAVGGFLAAYLDARTLKALVEATPDLDASGGPLSELLDAAPPAVLERLLDLLQEEGTWARTDVVRALVIRGFSKTPQLLAARLHDAKGASASLLLPILAQIDPAAALRKAVEAAGSADPELQKQALRLLTAAAFGPDTARALVRLMDSAFEDVRIAACAAMARGGARGFPALRSAAEKRANALGTAEAEAIGRALVSASARSALDLFAGWLKPRAGGLLGRLAGIHVSAPLQRVALAGLSSLEGGEAEGLLELLASRGERAIAQAAESALHARSRGTGGRRG